MTARVGSSDLRHEEAAEQLSQPLAQPVRAARSARGAAVEGVGGRLYLCHTWCMDSAVHLVQGARCGSAACAALSSAAGLVPEVGAGATEEAVVPATATKGLSGLDQGHPWCTPTPCTLH